MASYMLGKRQGPIRRNTVRTLLLAFFIVPSPRVAASSCTQLLVDLLNLVANTSIVLGSIQGGKIAEKVYRTSQAAWQGKRYLGLGIFYDKESVMAQFSTDIQRWFRDPQEHELDIVRAVTLALHGDYDFSLLERMTSNPFRCLSYRLGLCWHPISEAKNICNGTPAGPNRGICDHKARVMTVFLNDLGISAKYIGVHRRSQPLRSQGHAVVSLPHHDLIADPTAGSLTLASEFWKAYIVLMPADFPFFN